MARLNLTIPDSLYERLDRLRDRVNVSKICALALAKELDMLEGSTLTVSNPAARRMIERLQNRQTHKDRWFRRGYEDGENWAADVAETEELRYIMDDWDLDPESRYRFEDVEFPESFARKPALEHWLREDQQESEPEGRIGDLREALNRIDQDSYLRGWARAVQELWEAARPSLSWLRED